MVWNCRRVSLLPIIKADFNGTFPSRGTHLLSRSANTIHNGPNTRSKLLAVLAGICAQKANRAESTLTRGDSRRKNRRSKPSEITLAGRRGCSWRECVSDTLAFTRKPPPNAYPPAFISKTFHCRFTVILSRISWSKLRGVDTGQADPYARADVVFAERVYIPVIKIRNNLTRNKLSKLRNADDTRILMRSHDKIEY